MTIVEIKRLPHGAGLELPSYETAGSAGMDLRAAVADGETIMLQAGARALVDTGLAMALPQGFEAQIRPRSGLAIKHGITSLIRRAQLIVIIAVRSKSF